MEWGFFNFMEVWNRDFLRQYRIMGQVLSARDFVSSESGENGGILDVFPIFHTARLEQKIRRKPQLPLCGVALIVYHIARLADALDHRGSLGACKIVQCCGWHQRF